MARRIAKSLGGASTLSYIDMISGGFGSAFFLFLIFVSFPIDTASTPSSGSRFLDVWVEWQDVDVSAYIEIAYTPVPKPGFIERTFKYSLNSQSFHRSTVTGQVSYSGSAPQFWIGLAEAGYTQVGSSVLVRMEDANHVHGQWLRFSDPCPGRFQVFVGSASPGGLIDLLAARIPGRKSKASARIIMSNGKNVTFFPDLPPASKEVEFMTGLGMSPVEFKFDEQIDVTVPQSGAETSLLHCQEN